MLGAGKTSLARLLAESLTARLVLERHDENPFLADFYRDMRRHAFQAQIFFLLTRYRELEGFAQGDLFRSRLVADYLFAKDRIFASVNLDDQELRLYEQLYEVLAPRVPRPDVVVYLQASTDVLLARIQARGRSYERDIDPEYIRALNEAYNYYFFHYTETPLLVVNTDRIDFVKRPADYEDLVRRITSHASGTVYYAPLGEEGR